MSEISMDAFQLRSKAGELEDAGNDVGKAAQGIPAKVDAGEASVVVADLLSLIGSWAAKSAEVSLGVAHIAREVANRTMANEDEVAAQLNSIRNSVEDH